MTFGTLLRRSFEVTFRQPGVFFPIALMVNIPLILITIFSGTEVAGDAASLEAIGGPLLVVSMATWLLLQPLQTGAMAYGVFKQMSGESATLSECLGAASQRLIPLLGTTLLAGLVTILGMLMCIIPGILLSFGLFVAIPVVMVERNLGIVDTLKRSWDLTDGYKVTLFVFLLVLGIISFIPSFLLELAPIPVVSTLLPLALQVGLGTVQSVGQGVAYKEMRTAKEGTDTDDLLAVFE
ncbi:MAG: hypothetical protein K0U98_04460 [Deltaproteobacteria bacterium]|nr:hypothetical protein [Deltaproteobacteria bacterium]